MADLQIADSRDPSIACIVGSINSSCTSYTTATRVQASRQEEIADSEDAGFYFCIISNAIEKVSGMISELVTSFKKRNKDRLPDRVIFFR